MPRPPRRWRPTRRIAALGTPAGGLAAANRSCRRVGGLDFGYRSPFAALWGLLDGDGVLWVVGEHYGRYQPLTEHMQQLPRDVFWYADLDWRDDRLWTRLF